MRRYPTSARLEAKPGTFGGLKRPTTGRPVRPDPAPSILGELVGIKPARAFVPTSPEMDRLLGGLERGLPRAAINLGVRLGLRAFGLTPLGRYVQLLQLLWDLLHPPAGADTGKLSPAGWERTSWCEDMGWGSGVQVAIAQTIVSPNGNTCSRTQLGADFYAIGLVGQVQETTSYYAVTFVEEKSRNATNLRGDKRSSWKLFKPAVPRNLLYAPPDPFTEIELPTPYEVIPQADPWQAPAPNETRTPVVPVPLPFPYVPALPDYAPDGTPIRGPKPRPRPRPRPAPAPSPAPGPKPGPAPGPGPGPAPSPSPVPIPAPLPDPPGKPAPGPGVVTWVPSTSVAFEPSASGGRSVYRSRHFMSPPKPREKERKIKWQHAGQVLGVLNPFTEFCDMVDALYDALPKDLRWQHKLSFWKRGLRTPRCIDKAGFVYAHLDEVDVKSAISGLITNEIGDRIFGELSRRQGETWRNTGRAPIGTGFGARQVFGITQTFFGG